MQTTDWTENKNSLSEQYTLLQLGYADRFERHLRQAEQPSEAVNADADDNLGSVDK